MTEEISPSGRNAGSVFAGRIDILYALGRHYLSLPFAVLCVPATLVAGHAPGLLSLMPLLLLLGVAIAAEQLTAAYRKRARLTGAARADAPDSDPHFWARRYTFVSAISGASWGVAALFWFVPGSFPAQAYLSLAFLGMAATEFIARSAHRPAYLAHTVLALGPLVALLLIEGGLYADCTAVLIVLFAGVLISYCQGMARLLDESVHLRNENGQLVIRLQREKREALTARDAAQSSAMAKSAFIANISHELRTPLNALLGMAQLLERAELPKQQADHVKVMLQAGRGLQTLIDDVITLTRDDSGQLEDEDCDPLQAARAVVRLSQARAWEKRLHLTLSHGSGLPRVAADPRKVRQVLLKLTDNALKFTEHGLVDIRLEVSEDGQAVRFSVTDTGHGVAPEVAHLLFKPFSPGDSSYTRREQGAGLGLAVAKRVIEQAGGSIGFSSTPGEGAHFFFTVPVSGATAGYGLRPEPDSEHPAPAGLSLLMFLRAPTISDTLADMLEPFGNRVVRADDMAEAVARAGKEHFDAIISCAGDADMLAASPGVKAPLIAVLLRGDRAPAATDSVLRWPVGAYQLYRALEQVRLPQENPQNETETVAAIDPVAFSTLEKSVGMKTLTEILQCYIVTAEELTGGLAEACAAEKWDDAARLAQDIVGAAGGLGLAAITQAARHFAQAARDGGNRHELRNAAQTVVGEHVRVRAALIQLYPGMS
ncbi:MAG TPA: ATP-binding protein [Rhizomicrobium sp.]|jgi:signal transduction histidine kinase/HPt (histidine-containing phosphotransfer) domain-containing protein|nr:ATP-binding protein [Rhizomicrobium sp.]